jgi:predicted AlkP superfamily phosphohydrolase/phosphomutase
LSGWRRWGPLAIALAWTGAGGYAVAIILQHPPGVMELAGHPFFFAGWGDVFWLWCLGLTFCVAFAIPRRALRRRVVIGAVVFGGALAWVALSPTARTPEPRSAAPGETRAIGEDRTTLLVAIDGMSWSAILPMVRRGELPTIRRLMAEGSYGVLHSLRSHRETVDRWGYWSPVVWTSIATGVGPERHGITDFTIAKKRGGREVATSYDRKAPAFWNLFSAFDRTVAVVGWWATWPAEEVSGYMASSNLGLRGMRRGKVTRWGLTYPPELVREPPTAGLGEDELRSWVEDAIFPFKYYPILRSNELKTIYSVLWQDRLYEDIALDLIRRAENLDLYAVYFEGIDALSHHFWAAMEGQGDDVPPTFPTNFHKHREIVPRYYRIVDGYVADLLAEMPDDVTVILVSDHGFHVDPSHSKGADHSPYGVIIARGPGIRRDHDLNMDLAGSLRESIHGTTGVLDVLPTLLYLHGVPIAEDLPGSVLTAMLTDDLLDRQPVFRIALYRQYDEGKDAGQAVSPEVSEEYEQRLRALGYIQ